MFHTATSPRTQVYLYVVTALSIIFLSLVYAYTLSPLFFILDDPYIVLHNIQVLITGHDNNYPGVSALNGTTSLLHLILVRIFAVLFPPIWALYIVNWCAILLYAMGLLRLAFICKASLLQTILFLLCGLITGLIPLHLLSGLEPPLAFALLIWTFIFIYTKHRITSNILLGLLPWVRPELILFTGILWLSRAIDYWKQQQNYRFVLRHLFIDFFLIGITVLPFIFIYWIALGIPYPETLAAKRYFFAEQYLPLHEKAQTAFHNLTVFGFTFGIFNFIALLCLMLFTPLSRLFLLFFIAFFLLYLYFFPGALCHNDYRYLYIWLPFMLCGMMICNQHISFFIRSLSLLLLINLTVPTLYYFPAHWKNYLALYHYASSQHAQIKNWCEKNLPPHSTLLIQDAGYIAYATSFHLIDLVGLKTPANIHYHRQLTFPSAGKKRALALAEIIRATQPQYMIITKEWENLFQLTEGLKQQNIKLKPLTTVHEYLIYQFVKKET